MKGVDLSVGAAGFEGLDLCSDNCFVSIAISIDGVVHSLGTSYLILQNYFRSLIGEALLLEAAGGLVVIRQFGSVTSARSGLQVMFPNVISIPESENTHTYLLQISMGCVLQKLVD